MLGKMPADKVLKSGEQLHRALGETLIVDTMLLNIGKVVQEKTVNHVHTV